MSVHAVRGLKSWPWCAVLVEDSQAGSGEEGGLFGIAMLDLRFRSHRGVR